jgi:hypothetical protein
VIEMLVGLNVIDDKGYLKYREGMTPILSQFSGSFGYDFKIDETLKSETESLINRVFTIRFESKELMDVPPHERWTLSQAALIPSSYSNGLLLSSEV